MAKKNALGRGLGALIEDNNNPDNHDAVHERQRRIGGVVEIPIDEIVANPYQPRTIFDAESLDELASSISEIGIIQPITLRRSDGGKYQLISGERRLRAAKISGLEKIPAYVREANDQNMLEMALVENIQREDLDAIEIAISYQRLIDECKLTQEILSQRVGKKRATVTNYIRLLKLPAEIQLGIKEKKLSMGHARTLVTIDDPKTQLKIYGRILDQELSVRKVEELVRNLTDEPKEEGETIPRKSVASDPVPREYESLKTQLQDFFNTGIDLQRNNNGRGKIVITFKSDDELERIIAIFDKLKS